ncbi:MAG: hypothetical protein KA953_04905 [Lachnospiraceae bacterium]|jgi:uncharacterized membrane protein YqiK|nr:hypothetical protein [Lachnospiraceae bacterium]
MRVLGIILIVIVVLFVLLFVVYITNGDSKLIEKIYNFLIKHHDRKTVEEKI